MYLENTCILHLKFFYFEKYFIICIVGIKINTFCIENEFATYFANSDSSKCENVHFNRCCSNWKSFFNKIF